MRVELSYRFDRLVALRPVSAPQYGVSPRLEQVFLDGGILPDDTEGGPGDKAGLVHLERIPLWFD
jgi:hypothetical protein